jgi:hypothetical protein
MPVKQKAKRSHHIAHKKERRNKRFLKVYAPYIPLVLIMACSIGLSLHTEGRSLAGRVQSYAINTSDDGLLEATNKERQNRGLQALKFNTVLDKAAQAKAEDMASKNYWSHNTPDGREPWIFIETQNYDYRKAAENLAYGFSNSNSTLNGWMNSPGHRANVLDPELQEVGFGIINIPDYQNRGPQTLVVAMYGQPFNPTLAGNEASQPVKPTAQPVVQAASEPRNVTFIQSLTAGKAPWSSFAVGLLIGGILSYLCIAHIRTLRRVLRTSENFVIHHPLFDATMVALLVLAVIVSQSVGSIY